jgi:hypothetical protein
MKQCWIQNIKKITKITQFNCENPSSNTLLGGRSGFPPGTLKVVPKTACDSDNCSESRRNSTNESEGKREQKFDVVRLMEQSLELLYCSTVSVFKEPSRNFTFIFLLTRLKVLKTSAHVQKVLIWFSRPAKKYPSGYTIPLIGSNLSPSVS